jgi:hypothetical protein
VGGCKGTGPLGCRSRSNNFLLNDKEIAFYYLPIQTLLSIPHLIIYLDRPVGK